MEKGGRREVTRKQDGSGADPTGGTSRPRKEKSEKEKGRRGR